MEYRYLTGTGARVSRFSLGTMIYGSQVNEEDSIRIIQRALDLGINFIDTADRYNVGVTETIVGKALKGRRDGVVLASKVRWLVGDHELKDQGLSRWHVLRGVEGCLKRLQTECLDILFFHGADYNCPIEESLAAADKLVRDGKIMYYGLSNHASWQFCRSLWVCDQHHWQPPVVSQVPYNLVTRGIEQEFLPFCREMKVGVTVYNPLAGGLLTGKHDPTRPPAGDTRFSLNQEYFNRYWRDSHFSALATLKSIAREAGKTLVELALQWLVQQKSVDSIIVGASKLEHLEINIAAMEGKLDDDTLKACDAVWQSLKGDTFQYNR